MPNSPMEVVERIRANEDRRMWADMATALTLIATGKVRRVRSDREGRVLLEAL